MFVEEWPEKDRLLAEALTHFEDTAHCSGCGQLKSKAWDPDSAWEVGTVECYACKAHQDDKTESKPGELRFLSLDEKSMRIAKARKKTREGQQVTG